MVALIDAFFDLHREYDADVKTFVEAYTAGWPLPAQPHENLPHDVLMFGGKGTGKSTFARNWMGFEPFFPVVGELSRGTINDTIATAFKDRPRLIFEMQSSGLFGSSDAMNAIHEFLLWARLPVAVGISGARLAPNDFGWGRELDRKERNRFGIKTATTPISIAHLFFSDPNIAIKRIEARAAARQFEDPITDQRRVKLNAGQGQTFYAWPLVAQHASRVFLWDSRGDKLNLMALIDSPPGKRRQFYRIDNRALVHFQLGRTDCGRLWNLSQKFPEAYNQMWNALMTEMHAPVQMEPQTITALLKPNLTQAINTIRPLIKAPFQLKALDTGASTLFQIGRVGSEITAFAKIDHRKPWKDQLSPTRHYKI